MLALRRFNNKLVRGTIPKLSSVDSQDITTAYEQKETKPIGLIVDKQTGGHLLVESGGVKEIPFPHNYDHESRLVVLFRVERTVKFAYVGADGASNILVKGDPDQPGRYCLTDVFQRIMVYNPNADSAQVQYTMFELPDLDLDSSFFGLVPPVIEPTDSGGGGESVANTCCSRTFVASARLDYSISNVTTGAWTTLVASTGGDEATRVSIFDSSGQTMELGIGNPGSESRLLLIPPGGIEEDVVIPAGSRLSIRAVSDTANIGEIDLNVFA